MLKARQRFWAKPDNIAAVCPELPRADDPFKLGTGETTFLNKKLTSGPKKSQRGYPPETRQVAEKVAMQRLSLSLSLSRILHDTHVPHTLPARAAASYLSVHTAHCRLRRVFLGDDAAAAAGRQCHGRRPPPRALPSVQRRKVQVLAVGATGDDPWTRSDMSVTAHRTRTLPAGMPRSLSVTSHAAFPPVCRNWPTRLLSPLSAHPHLLACLLAPPRNYTLSYSPPLNRPACTLFVSRSFRRLRVHAAPLLLLHQRQDIPAAAAAPPPAAPLARQRRPRPPRARAPIDHHRQPLRGAHGPAPVLRPQRPRQRGARADDPGDATRHRRHGRPARLSRARRRPCAAAACAAAPICQFEETPCALGRALGRAHRRSCA